MCHYNSLLSIGYLKSHFCGLLMQHINNHHETNSHPVLLIAAADNSEGLPPTIRRCFSHETKMGPLTEEQRVEMLSQSLHRIPELLPDVSKNILFLFSVFYLFLLIIGSRINVHIKGGKMGGLCNSLLSTGRKMLSWVGLT